METFGQSGGKVGRFCHHMIVSRKLRVNIWTGSRNVTLLDQFFRDRETTDQAMSHNVTLRTRFSADCEAADRAMSHNVTLRTKDQ